MTLWAPSVPDPGVRVTVQVAVVLFIVVSEEHAAKLVAAFSRKKLTPPVGATDVPGERSLIVAVQGLFEPTGTVFEVHARIAVEVLMITRTATELELAPCEVSGEYAAITLWDPSVPNVGV